MNTTTTTKTRRTRSLLATAAVAVVLLPGLLAGCSSAEDTDADGSTVAAGKGATLAECMRGKGYDMADPSSGGQTMQFGAPDGVDPEQYQADLKECIGDGGGAGDGKMAKPMEGAAEQQRQAAACIREGGFSDYPDDEAGRQAYQPDDRAAFDEVARACDEEAFGSETTGIGE
ncbi:hypothetical protein [Curtobacterium oceanosedimentum]|uniref:hypothetical protein n=1 Tax=Curtobacterium oceanosedimentum TaxID=465820 RepID=UPI001CE056C1|nr:hypothetical protein [Curtobacterium oceanosedimentum]MCA5922341.1 hypothetical protein [Curtobacterium oceanosedimentum]